VRSDLVECPADRPEMLVAAPHGILKRGSTTSLLGAAGVKDEVVREKAQVGVEVLVYPGVTAPHEKLHCLGLFHEQMMLQEVTPVRRIARFRQRRVERIPEQAHLWVRSFAERARCARPRASAQPVCSAHH